MLAGPAGYYLHADQQYLLDLLAGYAGCKCWMAVLAMLGSYAGYAGWICSLLSPTLALLDKLAFYAVYADWFCWIF
jgi:hypothetical protein